MKLIDLSIKNKSFIFSMFVHLIVVWVLKSNYSNHQKLPIKKPKPALKVFVLRQKLIPIKKTWAKANLRPSLFAGLPEIKQRQFDKNKKIPTHGKEVFKIAYDIPRLSKRRVLAKNFRVEILNKMTLKAPPSITKYKPKIRRKIDKKSRKVFPEKRIIRRKKVEMPEQLVYGRKTKIAFDKKVVNLYGAEQKRIWNSFKSEIFEKIKKNKRHPRWPGRHGTVIKVKVLFELKRDGTVEEVKVLIPSAIAILNRAALNSVKRSTPFPPFPEEIKQDSVRMGVTILFTA